jgi:hypothetical protein
MKQEETNFVNRVSKLSPELQLLLWSIRVDDQFLDKAKKYLYAEKSVRNISKLLRMSHNKGLTQLLYSRIKMLDRAKIDQGLLKSFKEIYFSNIADNMKLSNNLGRIFQLLEKNGLNPVAFKGPALGIISYNDIALRFSSDLDIMIRNCEFKAVIKILIKNGYSVPVSAKKKIIQYTYRTWRDINVRKGDYHFDIHQQIAKGLKSFRPDDETFKSCKKVKLNKIDIKTFSAEDSLVIMAINSATDGFSSLKHFRDISGIVINNPELNWERVLLSAENKKSLKMVKISLKFCQLFCGLKLPGHIADQINERSINRLFNVFVNRLFSRNFKLDILTCNLTVPKSLDIIFSKIRFYLWFLRYPSPQMHPAIFRLPGKLFFIIPFIAPFYLIYDYLSRFFKIKMKQKTEVRRQKSEHRR